jgi:hypothetical protein
MLQAFGLFIGDGRVHKLYERFGDRLGLPSGPADRPPTCPISEKFLRYTGQVTYSRESYERKNGHTAAIGCVF